MAMIRKARSGERVELSGTGEAYVRGSSTMADGKTVAHWPVDIRTGTVKSTFKMGKQKYIIVVPDAPGFGNYCLRPKQLNRIQYER